MKGYGFLRAAPTLNFQNKPPSCGAGGQGRGTDLTFGEASRAHTDTHTKVSPGEKQEADKME